MSFIHLVGYLKTPFITEKIGVCDACRGPGHTLKGGISSRSKNWSACDGRGKYKPEKTISKFWVACTLAIAHLLLWSIYLREC